MKTDGKNVKWKSKEQREKENRRIRWIFLILFLLVLLGFGGMGYRVWKQYIKDLMQNQYDQLSNSSKILSESLETSMKEYEWDYEMLHNIEVMMQDEAGNYRIQNTDAFMQKMKRYLEEETTYVCDLFWQDENGNFINSLSGKVYADPVCFTETDQGVGIYQMEDDKDQKYLVLHYLEPSENQICMVVNEEAFYANLISSIKVGTNGYVMIKNSEGKIIMHPKGEQWGIDVIEGRKEMYPHLDLSSLEHMIEKQKEGGEGILEYDSYWWTMPNLPKVHKVSAYSSADLGGDFWVVSAVIDYDDMYLPIRQGFTRILFVMLGILLLIIILLIFVGRLVFDRQKSAAEIIYLRELNSLLEEVHQSEENIAHQERLQIMGTMTGGIAHEFNNFLTPIMGYAELLMMELPEDSEEYDSAHEIYEASEKAKDVVRQISTLSRKNVETVYKSIPAQKLMQRAVKMISSVCPPQVTVEEQMNLDHTWILGNTTQINQVLLNISVNAIHAIGKQKGTIRILAHRVKRNSLSQELADKLRESWEDYVEIQIQDTGCVIALLVNYPGAKLQNKIIKSHSGPALMMASTILAAGVFLGVLEETEIMNHMANVLATFIPQSMGRFLPLIIGVLSVPLTLLFCTDSYFFGLLPVLISIGNQFGVNPAHTAIAMVVCRNCATFISPVVPATFLGVGLAGVEIKDHIKASFFWIWGVSIVCLISGVLLGVIHF